MAVNVNEALDIIYNNSFNPKFEIVPIENAQARTCAQEVVAIHALPKFDNSAMDGYAILFEDSNNNLRVEKKMFAGDDVNFTLKTNTCVKIMTGAKIPLNATAVVPQECVELIDEEHIKVPDNITPFQHIRYIGEDIKENDVLIKIGTEINSAQITLLSSQGYTHIKVFKKPKVVVFSSGEELKLHYEQVENYQIYNSNTPTLLSRVKELGCDVSFIGGAKDSIESLSEFIKNSLDADLIITSGGVSVGEADFTRDALNTFDYEVLFDGIKIKPGKPTVLGKIHDTLVLSLPGNPLAATMIFEMFGKVILQTLLGTKDIYHNTISTKISKELKSRPGRVTLLPGYFNGQNFEVSSKNAPGMVSVLSGCNSFLVLHESVEKLSSNTEVKILPITWKFMCESKKDYITK
ncbi:molybdopterin molybdenumtransferase MoeA [Arcobacter sp. HD9-500m-PIT-SAG03]|nr:molybdopterin molybdenumtransferase MoeA [Arcobacter sp. HD9-500m-PIT-SAG03]